MKDINKSADDNGKSEVELPEAVVLLNDLLLLLLLFHPLTTRLSSSTLLLTPLLFRGPLVRSKVRGTRWLSNARFSPAEGLGGAFSLL